MLGVSICVAMTCACLWYFCKRKGGTLSLPLVLMFAGLFRVIGGFTFPVLEDDFYRFLWDGYRTANDGTPYGVPPSVYFGTELSERFELILDSINYPDVSTVYGPAAQWFFYLAYLIAPGEIWPLRLLIIVADLSIILLLARKSPALILMLYAWSPLVIKEFAISLHPDILGALFMLLALHAYTDRKDYILGALLALAAGVKLFALIILPFLFLWRWKAWASFCITGVVIALPFGVVNAWLPDGLSAMSTDWLFNAPLYEALIRITSMDNAKLLLVTAFILIGGVYGLRWALREWQSTEPRTRPIPRGDLLFALLFLCIPAFNPWYAIWLIPFALYWPRFWVWVGSITLLLSYATGINLGPEYAHLEDYQHPTWVLASQFGLIFMAFVVSKSPRLNRLSKEKIKP